MRDVVSGRMSGVSGQMSDVSGQMSGVSGQMSGVSDHRGTWARGVCVFTCVCMQCFSYEGCGTERYSSIR